MCRRLGLGRPPHRIGAMGISMGGYGALLLAEKHPRLIAAVAAISPAIWTSYAQARTANAGAYASAADFAADDAITHAAALARVPVRVAAGYADPFYPGVRALAGALPRPARSLTSPPAATPAPSSRPSNRRHWRSWPAISPPHPQPHPARAAGIPRWLPRSRPSHVGQLFRPDLEHPTRADAEPAFGAMHKLPVNTLDPVDISEAVLYLASDASRYVTGQQLKVDAGALLPLTNSGAPA